MKTMHERTEIIRNLIKQRVRNLSSINNDVSIGDVNAYTQHMVWGSPEGTIFNIIQTYFTDSEKGKSETQIIKEFDQAFRELEGGNTDRTYNFSTLPNNINEYILFRLNREFHMIAHFYDNDFILYCKKTIYDEMGHSRQTISQQASPITKDFSVTSNKTKEGCFIATSCYGSYDTPEVFILREFRDGTLKKSKLGLLFIATYYRISPIFVRHAMNKKLINKLMRRMLDRFVHYLDRRNNYII